MKHYTTIEQSKKLLELGLNPETADMYYCEEYIGRNNDHFYTIPPRIGPTKYGNLPCWSLGALLEVMPMYLYNEYGDFFMVSLDHNSEGWNVSYGGEEEYDFSRFADENGKTPLEATYSMVIYLLENGFIKKKLKTFSE